MKLKISSKNGCDDEKFTNQDELEWNAEVIIWSI